MLKRQAVLLRFLERAGRPVSHFEMVKWSFILKTESSSMGGDSFFDFLPYKKGPFSFCLYQEAGKLEENGYMMSPDDSHWRITEKGAAVSRSLESNISRDVDRVIQRFEQKAYDDLVQYVYSRNPWFTVNSTIRKEEMRPICEVKVFTAGYESLSIDSFLNGLMRKGIQRVIDVRSNPIARRYGFHKSTLSRLCGYLDIDYVHIPELGIPSSMRQTLETLSDYEKLFAEYDASILPYQEDAVARVCEMMQGKPSVLICMEADPRYCHRTRIAKAVSAKISLSISDIGAVP
mgnify:CR=1 FL=1